GWSHSRLPEIGGRPGLVGLAGEVERIQERPGDGVAEAGPRAGVLEQVQTRPGGEQPARHGGAPGPVQHPLPGRVETDLGPTGANSTEAVGALVCLLYRPLQ